MRIPLPKMLRHWREREFERHLKPAREEWALRLWAFAAARPWAYRVAARLASWGLRRLARGKGRLASLPLAGAWTATRDLPAPSGRTFLDQWNERRGS